MASLRNIIPKRVMKIVRNGCSNYATAKPAIASDFLSFRSFIIEPPITGYLRYSHYYNIFSISVVGLIIVSTVVSNLVRGLKPIKLEDVNSQKCKTKVPSWVLEDLVSLANSSPIQESI